MRPALTLLAVLLLTATAAPQVQTRLPIIDMHLHARHADYLGPISAGVPHARRVSSGRRSPRLAVQPPQVYVDIGSIVYTEPRPAFYRFLQELVEAGYGDRVMFGSDQMSWPGIIGPSIEAIESAPFLSAQQRRDILYNNAARFLRLSPEQTARHHRM